MSGPGGGPSPEGSAGGASSGSGGGAAGSSSGGASGSRGSAAGRAAGGATSADVTGESGPDGGAASMTFTPKSAALARGRDWALKNKSPRATAITRPIRVRCLPDRLVIMPERGDDARPKEIPLNSSVQTALDPFVNAIWKHTERWGLAVANGYWKPILHVEVAPGGEANHHQLEALLQGSGLEVIRK